MKANSATAWAPDAYKEGAYHSVAHNWIEDCDSGLNKCAPVEPGTNIDFEAMRQAAGGPCIIQAKDFDPEKHEYATGLAGDKSWHWSDEPPYYMPSDFPLPVRDKPEPPPELNLNEKINSHLNDRGYIDNKLAGKGVHSGLSDGITDVVRRHFKSKRKEIIDAHLTWDGISDDDRFISEVEKILFGDES